MSRSGWARSGARAPAARGARPSGSWAASVARARAAWDGLEGYSDAARAAILGAALGLWADTAAALGGDDDGDGLDDTADMGTD